MMKRATKTVVATLVIVTAVVILFSFSNHVSSLNADTLEKVPFFKQRVATEPVLVDYGMNYDEFKNPDGSYKRVIYPDDRNFEKVIYMDKQDDDLVLHIKDKEVKIILSAITSSAEKKDIEDIRDSSKSGFFSRPSFEYDIDIMRKNKIEEQCAQETTQIIPDPENSGDTLEQIICLKYENVSVPDSSYKFSWDLKNIPFDTVNSLSSFQIDFISEDVKIIREGNKIILDDEHIIDLSDLINSGFTLQPVSLNGFRIQSGSESINQQNLLLDPTVTGNGANIDKQVTPSAVDDDATLAFDDGSGFIGLIYYDVNALPIGVNVTYAEIDVYYSTTSSSDVRSIYPIISNQMTGSVNWNTYDGSNAWNSPGLGAPGSGESYAGDYNNTVGYFASHSGGTGHQIWVVTNWYRETLKYPGTQPDYGWLMLNADASNHIIVGSESGTADRRPTLTITYNYPEPEALFFSPSNGTILDEPSVTLETTMRIDHRSLNANMSAIYWDVWWFNETLDDYELVWFLDGIEFNSTSEFGDVNGTRYANLTINSTNSYLGDMPDGLYLTYPGYGIILERECAPGCTGGDTIEINSQGLQYEFVDYYFYIDTTPPVITYVSPTPSNNTATMVPLSINVSITDLTGADTCTIQDDDGSPENFTMTKIGSACNYTFSSLSEGTHHFTVFTNDSAGNLGSSEIRTLSIDTTPPTVSIAYPTATDYNVAVSALNYSASDVNLASCWYSTNNGVTNTSVTCGQNVTGLSASQGSNTWRVWANDTGGNLGSASVTFNVDTIAPSLNIVYPSANGLYFNSDSINVNYTITETNQDSCWWTDDGGATNTSLASCGTNITGQTWAEGSNTVIIYANDTFGNINSSSRQFYIDTVFPQFTFGGGIWTVASGEYVNRTFINVNVTASEHDGNHSIFIYNKDHGLEAVGTNTTSLEFFWGITDLTPDQRWFINVTGCDLANNCNSSTTFNFTVDTGNPNATHVSPGPNFVTTNPNQNLTFNVTDGIGVKNATLFVYNESGIYNQTTVTFVEDVTQSTIGIVVALADGLYNWFINVWDWAGHSYTTGNQTILVDTLVPTIQFQPPTETNNTFLQVDTISFNFTGVEDNLDTGWVQFGNTNYTTTCVGDPSYTCNLTLTSVADGIYSYAAFVNDSAGQQNNTEFRVVNIDTNAPIITIVYPSANGNWFQSDSIGVNYTIVETNPDTCWWTRDSGATNNTITCGTNITGQTWDEGSNEITIYANDSAGAEGSATRQFYIDTVDPVIDWGTGIAADGANLSQSNIYFNTSYTEVNVANFTFFHASSPTACASGTGQNSTSQSLNKTSLSDGDYTYCVRLTDLSGRAASTSQRTIRLDTGNPTATLNTPQNDTKTSTAEQNYTVNATDSLGIQNGTLFIYNSTNDLVNSTTVQFAADVTQTTLGIVVTLADGVYKWFYSFFDWAGNSVTTGNNTILIDTTQPTISITSPSSGVNLTSALQTIEFTATDTNREACWYTFDSGATNTSVVCSVGSFQDTFSQGSNTLVVYVNDSAGNENSDNVQFNIDSINPSVSIVHPASDGLYFNYLDVDVNFTTTDTNLDSCWYTNSSGATNTSITCGTNITAIDWPQGSTTVLVYANDTFGNIGSDSIQFSVDTIYPEFSFDAGVFTVESGEYINRTFVNVNVTATEEFGNHTIFIYNSTHGLEASGTNSTHLSFFWGITDMTPDGRRFINVTGCDLANNCNSSTTFNFTVDTGNPNATQISPPTTTITTDANQNFTFNVSDGIGIKNATLYIYNESGDLINETTTTFPEDVTESTIGIVVALADGVYNWFIKVFDWFGHSFTTGNYTITVDTNAPSINYNANTDADGIWKQTGDIFINVSASDDNLDSVRFEFNGVNETFANSGGGDYWENKTGLTTGTYTFYAWANDTAGTTSLTSVRTIHLDLENPSVNIIEPNPQSYNTNESLPLNISFSDTNLDSCWYNFNNDANVSITCGQNYTFNISEGTHTVYAFANDSSGRLGTDSVTFVVSLAPPSITLDYPEEDQWLNYSQDINFNYTATDSEGIDFCELWTDTTGVWHLNQTDNSVSSGVQSTFLLNASDGDYIWNVFCQDPGANGAWGNPTGNNTFHIDTVYPVIDYTTGTDSDGTNKTQTNIFVNVSVTEVNEEVIIFRLYNSTGGVYNSTSSTSGLRSINWTGLDDGTYTFNVTINDSASNTASTSTRTVTIDTAHPEIEIISPESINYATNESINLNYTVTDVTTDVNTCWYSVKNSSDFFFITDQILAGCQNTTFSVPSGDIDYIVVFNANDTVGNTESVEVLFGVRTIAPAIVLNNPPSNQHYPYLENIRFNFTATDTNGVDSDTASVDTCRLEGNWTGTWHINQTLTDVVSANQTNFELLNLTEGTWGWNVWCNDTLGNSDYAQNNLSFTLDITSPVVNITFPENGTSVDSTFNFNYTNNDLHIFSCAFNILDNATWLFSPNQSLVCGNGTRQVSVSAGTYDLYVWGTDTAGNMNQSIITFTATGDDGGGGGGGGGTQTETIVEVPSNRTFCGDLICQVDGNDNGLREDFFSCPQDCPGFNIDTAIFGCFVDDPELQCIWDQNAFKYIGMFLGILAALLAFSTVPDSRGRQIPLYQYYIVGKRRKGKQTKAKTYRRY